MKIHKNQEGEILGICDSELLGKKFSEGELILNVNIEFFGGKNSSLKAIIVELAKCRTANIIGNKIIEELLGKNILKESNVKTVKKTKYAHIYRL